MAVPVWQKNIGGVLSEIAKSVVELPDSSLVIAGYTSSFGNGGYDAYIIKTDKNGNLLWQKTFGGTDWDFAYSINNTSDGNLIVCGTTYSFGRGENDAFILKLDYNGNFLWTKTYGGTKSDDLKEIVPTLDGGFIATGTTKSYGDSLGDIWVTKFNSSGDSTWFKTHGGVKKDVGNTIVQNANADYFIGGGSESFGIGKEDAYVFKLNSSGNFLWSGYEGKANEDEEIYSLKNSYEIVGGIVFCYTTREITAFGMDSKTLLYDQNGYYVNGGRVGSTGMEEVFSIANCKDNGYIVAGYTTGFASSLSDVFIVKFDSVMNAPGAFTNIGGAFTKNGFDVRVYPNPFVKDLLLKVSDNEIITKIEIINLNGESVFWKNDLNSNLFEIKNIELATGIYTLKIVTSGNTYFSKIFCNK
ncbi:MAG: T9SS type A sorting domain-containing protein [Bacteroidota bacterium]